MSLEPGGNRYAYALDRLRRFTALTLRFPELEEVRYQMQQIIFEEFKRYAKEPGPTAKGIAMFSDFSLGLVLAGSFVTCATVLAWCGLVVSRARVLMFAPDKSSTPEGYDFRMAGAYRWLSETRTPHGLAFHALLGRRTVTNAWKRRRFGIYLETCDFLYTIYGRLTGVPGRCRQASSRAPLEAFPEDERAFVRLLLTQCLWIARVAKVRRVFWRMLFRTTAIRTAFVMDDNRYFHELVWACRAASVRCHLLQHGHFTKYHVGWTERVAGHEPPAKPDTFIVTSAYWKGELERLGSWLADVAVVGGSPKRIGSAPSMPARKPKDPAAPLRVHFSFESGSPHAEVREYLKRLVGRPDVRLVFSVRPDADPGKSLGKYGLARNEVELVTGALEPHAAAIDVSCGTYSTLLYELVEMGVPVAIIATSIDYGEGMVTSGLAERVTLEPDLVGQLRRVAERGTAKAEERRKRLVEGERPIGEVLAGLLRDDARGRR